jgi:hypothetical protein
MKQTLTLIAIHCVLSVCSQQTKILWLGNSYTAVNNLPQVFYNLSLSAGDTVIFDSNTPGGTTLQYHATNATSIQKIYSQKWDYVVVQAQSQEPSFPPNQVATQTLPYARLLDSLITDNDSCTETVFYMTWGRKYGDQSNCANYAPLCTFEGMQARLRESYLQMANDNHAITSPVGMAWQQSWHTDSLINLWDADNSHPNAAGTYLTACVFYGTIFRKSPVGIVYSPLSAQATNTHIQTIAYHTVFDSLANWNVGSFLPKAAFDFTGSEATKTYTFNNQSQNFTQYLWNFGDGNNSTTSGIHTYADTGTYTVSLVVKDDCGNADSTAQTFSLQNANHLPWIGISEIKIYPNPAQGKIEVIIPSSLIAESFEIINNMGQVLQRGKWESLRTVLPLSEFSRGVYFLKTGSTLSRISLL